MRALLLTFCAVLFVAHLTEVASLTNEEFLELVKPYAEEIKFVDKHDAVDDDINDAMAVVELQGGPSDELDVRSLLDDFQRDLPRSISGGCSRSQCEYCYRKTFKLKTWLHTFKHKMNACVRVTYLRHNYGVRVEITYNNIRLLSREISLVHPPALCYNMSFGRVCAEIHNVNLRSKSLCVRVFGEVDIKFKKYRVDHELACFHF